LAFRVSLALRSLAFRVSLAVVGSAAREEAVLTTSEGPMAGGRSGSGLSSGKSPYHSLRIKKIIQETEDARSIVLEIPPHLEEAFHYRAGQFLTFRVTVGGDSLMRCYSLSSSPAVDRERKFTVKRIEDGRVSNWMNDALSVGDALDVLRPTGIFCLRESERPIIAFSGGSGITPVISIIKGALASTDRCLKLLYANRNRGSIIFRNELEALVTANPDRFELAHRLDDEQGYIDPGAVAHHVAGQVDADFYLCGPGPFMDVVEAALATLGVAADRIFIERFVSLDDEERPPPHPGAVSEGEETPDSLAIQLGGRTHEVPYKEGETVLEAVKRAGLDPPFACEEGYCGCCMAKLIEGEVRMKANDCLDDKELSEGYRLTCQSIPVRRTIRIEYPD
jgi:3-ketosteroid 9alpha-monooxygenase subunit B